MATTPQVKAFTGTSVEVLNAIRNSSSYNYQNFVPFAQPDSASVKKIGAVIMQYPALQNEFLNNLINRIARVIVTSKMYSNPWAMFKKGIIEIGESVEEIFVNIAKVNTFDPSVAEEEVFKRVIPDVRSTFHIMNYQKFYKDTISDDQLRQAFTSWDGVTDLIARITESMYASANYDEFLVMKYIIARRFLDSNFEFIDPDGFTTTADIAKSIKSVSNSLEFMNTRNVAGVNNFTPKDEQYIICTADFDASMDIDVLAFAFNMDKAEFAGHRVLVDSFGFTDNEISRLDTIFEGDPTYRQITNGAINNRLKSAKCLICSRDYMRIYDNLIKFTEIYNAQGLYWNYSLHTWKTFSTSPFEPAIFYCKTFTGTYTISKTNMSTVRIHASNSSAPQKISSVSVMRGETLVDSPYTINRPGYSDADIIFANALQTGDVVTVVVNGTETLTQTM